MSETMATLKTLLGAIYMTKNTKLSMASCAIVQSKNDSRPAHLCELHELSYLIISEDGYPGNNTKFARMLYLTASAEAKQIWN